jgi:nucleoside-diphosphate-sugar epimerase
MDMYCTLVTGGSGFIGRHVVERLHDGGEGVVSYDRAPATGLPAGVGRVQGELFDLRRLVATLEEHRVTQIVHAAGMADPQLSVGMPTATVAANAVGTVHLLEAARLADFAGRIVLLSSTSVHGHHDDLIDEASPLRPRTPYAATKAFSDLLGQVYSCSYGLDVVSLRLSEAYGPGRTLPNLVQDILDAAIEGRPLRLEAGADHPLHPIHVDDVARAVVAALGAPAPRTGVYVVTGGERVPLGRVVALVRDRIPGADIRLGAGEGSDLDRQGAIDTTAADRELGYRPRWGLARGIDDYCAWREAESPADTRRPFAA